MRSCVIKKSKNMEYIKEFIKHKESKGEKAIYRVNDTRGYTYYSDDYVKWLEQQLRIHDVSGALGFDKGYEQGYNDATREACQEIAKNYQPNDR